MNEHEITKELRATINRTGLDTRTNVPDYILAEYLMWAATALASTIQQAKEWRGIPLWVSGQVVTVEDLPSSLSDPIPMTDKTGGAAFPQKLRDLAKAVVEARRAVDAHGMGNANAGSADEQLNLKIAYDLAQVRLRKAEIDYQIALISAREGRDD